MTRRMKQKTAFIMVYALLLGMLSGFVSDSASEAAGGEAALPEKPVSAAYVQPIPATPEPIESGEELKNPRTDADGVVTWDCVYFGNYWQEDTNGDGKADQEDEKQPVKWRVLSVDGDDAFLLADQNLDVQRYNDTDKEVTWETCTMRSWLNGYGADANMDGKDYSDNNFLNNAFSAGEQSAILDSTVVNDDNPVYGTEGGNDTSDKVYLLSIDEVTDPAYGFSSDYSKYDEGRRAKSEWWLRSPSDSSTSASSVDTGYVTWYDLSVGKSRAVRPALHINLKASSDALSTASWSYAGTVTSTGEVTGVASPSPVSTATPTADPGAVETAAPIPATDEPIATSVPILSFNGYEYSVDEDGGICITNYSGSEKELVIPGEIDGKKVTRIGKQAFGNKFLSSVTIPDSVTSIGDYAFYLNSMRSITIPYGVTSIGDYAFWYCTSLKSITIPASVTNIGIAAFFYCPDDLVISTTKGSYADDFGTRSGYTIKYIGEPAEPTSTPIPGEPPADLSPQIPMEPIVDTPLPATSAPEVKEPSPQASAKVKKPSPRVPAKVKKPTVKVKKKSVQLNWKKVSGVTGYEIWISGSKNFSKKTVTKSKTAKFTLKDLKRNRTYYVKIRAYTKTGGKVKYGKWSKVEKVKCK